MPIANKDLRKRFNFTSVKTKIKLLGTKTNEPHSSEAPVLHSPVAEDHRMRRATFVGKANWASFFQKKKLLPTNQRGSFFNLPDDFNLVFCYVALTYYWSMENGDRVKPDVSMKIQTADCCP